MLFKEKYGKKRKSHFSEIVQDVGLFRFADDSEFVFWVPPRKRSLFPSSSFNRRIVARKSGDNCSILLSIIGAKNLPEGESKIYPMKIASRSNEFEGYTTDSGIDKSLMSNSRSEGLGTLVSVKYKGREIYTVKVEGGQASNIPLDLSSMEEMIELLIFDVVENDVRHIGGFYEDEDSIFTERRFLGSVSFKIGSILSSTIGQIDGFVRCYSPDVIFGFKRSLGNSSNTDEENAGVASENDTGRLSIMGPQKRHVQTKSNLMLRIFATTEPKICVPKKGRAEIPSKETDHTLSRIRQWYQMHLNFGSLVAPETYCPILWPSDQFNWLVCRFLFEQNPPNGIDSVASCAHYVCLIPSLASWKAMKDVGREDDVVLTSQQCLDIQAGNCEERAVLLANYFLYLSQKNPDQFGADIFLVLGFGVPEGFVVSLPKSMYTIMSCLIVAKFTVLPNMHHDTLGNKRCMSCEDAELEVKSFFGMHRQESLMTYATTFRSKRYIAWFQRM